MNLTTYRPRLLCLPAICMLLLQLAACGQAQHSGRPLLSEPDPAKSAAFEAALPSLASLDLLKTGSFAHHQVYRGDNQIQSSHGVTYIEQDTLLDASADGPSGGTVLEYAIYYANPVGSQLISASASFYSVEGGVYMAVADYGLGRWKFSGPHTESALRDLSAGDYVSTINERVFVAFICAPGSSAVIDGWILREELPPPQSMAIDSEGQTGFDSCMLLVEGLPAIAYYDFGESRLRYVRASDEAGAAWGSPQTLEGGGTGRFPSMAIVEGNPALTYFDNTNEYLSYIRATDSTGENWGSPQDIDTSAICGEFSSLLMVEGQPAACYQSYGTESLRYIRANDGTGDNWGSPQDIDSIGSALSSVEGTSMLIADGNPAIAYYSYSESALKYIRASDGSGSAWDEPLVVDAVDDAGRAPSMLLVLDTPAICYGRSGSGSQHYVRASDSLGAAWSEPVLLDSEGDCGYMNSMLKIGGYPLAVSYDMDGGRLRYCQALDFAGSMWADSQTLDDAGDTGAHPSLIEHPDGVPGVSYTNVSEGDLLFLRLFEP